MTRHCLIGCAMFAWVLTVAALARATPPDLTPHTAEGRFVRLDARQGYLFAPSAPRLGAFRLGVGLLYDAVDPQVMYGYKVRVPQLTLDARFGLGSGWSFKARANSMLVTSELLIGGAYAWHMGQFSAELAANVGVYWGQLSQFSFNANLVAPQYRPELALSYRFGDLTLTLRAALLLMGPERARVGHVWGGLDNANLFVGHSEMLVVEDAQRSGAVWYFGLGVMTTRAYYQMWLLFPDSPGLFTYLRTVLGYEF